MAGPAAARPKPSVGLLNGLEGRLRGAPSSRGCSLRRPSHDARSLEVARLPLLLPASRREAFSGPSGDKGPTRPGARRVSSSQIPPVAGTGSGALALVTGHFTVVVALATDDRPPPATRALKVPFTPLSISVAPRWGTAVPL